MSAKAASKTRTRSKSNDLADGDEPEGESTYVPPPDPAFARRQPKRYPPGHPMEGIIFRIRDRRKWLLRAWDIVNYDKVINGDDWSLSDALREVIHDWIEMREGEIRLARAADFSGSPPED